MKYHKYIVGPYNLHTIKTNKFKKICLKVSFERKTKKEEITIRNFLCDILMRSTKKHPSERLMAIETEELYDLNCGSDSTISGNYSVISFNMSFLNEKYTDENIINDAIQFLTEILFEPNVIDGEFNKENFDLTKNALKDSIEGLKENTMRYSKIRMLEEMDNNLPTSYNADGYIDDLNKITPKSLYDYYLSVLKNDIVDIFIIGDISPSEIKKNFSKKFLINTIKHKQESHYIEHSKYHKLVKKVVEKKDYKQTKLVMGAKALGLSDFERQYVSVVYSFILGGGPDSKLFKNVREKNSLCYSVSSSFYRISNLLVISAGINKGTDKRTISLIKKEMKKMEIKDFNDSDVDKAITTYITSCKEMLDSPINIINNYLAIEYLNIDSLENRMQNIKKVTKDMVSNFAKKIHLDTIFVLEGDSNEDD